MRIIEKSRRSRWLLVVPATILAIAVIISLLAVTGIIDFPAKKPTPTTASTETKGETSNSTTSSTTNNTQSSVNSTTQDATNDSSDRENPKSSSGDQSTTTKLVIKPSDLVSAHKVKLDSPLVSVCNATSGATCVIEFTKDNVSKSLPAETSDRGGAAYWNTWQPKSIGLTVGTWKIKATATLGDQQESIQDAMNLEISE